MSFNPPSSGDHSDMDSDGKTNFHDPQTFHDRVLLVGGKQFYIQSGLLSVWSDFFRGLFYSDFKEKRAEEIEIKELTSDEFEIFLGVVYGEYLEIEEPHLKLLLRLADRFLAPKVTTICHRSIERNFRMLDKPMVLDLACTYNMHDIKKKTLEFIDLNDDFRALDPFMKVAFQHNLENLQNKLRERDNTSNYYTNRPCNIVENYEENFVRPPDADSLRNFKSEFAGFKGKFLQSILTVEYQRSGSTKLTLEGCNEYPYEPDLERTVEHLLFTEVVDLIRACHPGEIEVKNSQAEEARKWWKYLKNMFPKIIWKISLNVVGLGDMWDYNIKNVGAVLAEVVAKMVKERPRVLYIDLSKTHLTVSTEPRSYEDFRNPGDSSDQKQNFTVQFAGGWNLPTSYGTLFPIMLNNLLQDQKLVLFIDLPCQNCIEWVFKHMNWTFDDSTSRAFEEYENQEGESDEIKQSVVNFYRLRRYNKFVANETNTEVTYFYLKHCHDRSAFGAIRLRGC